jgi:hypothetical protein
MAHEVAGESGGGARQAAPAVLPWVLPVRRETAFTSEALAGR